MTVILEGPEIKHMIVSQYFVYTVGSGRLNGSYNVTVSNNNTFLVAGWSKLSLASFALDGNCVGKIGSYTSSDSRTS